MYPGVELRLLRYAVAVAEELHFGRAAQRLHVSQPSLSKQILQLEDYLGFKLFIRTKRSVELTPAGRTFVAEARKALHYSERAVELARKAEQQEHETLTIGYSSFIDLHFLSAIRRMKPLGSERPIYKSSYTAEIVAKLLSDEWHAGFVILPLIERDLTVKPLLREPLALSIPKSHPLARIHKIVLADLSNTPLILPPRRFNPHFHDHILSLLTAAGIASLITHEVTNPHESLHLVSEGLGVAIAQLSVLEFGRRDVVVRTFADTTLVVETAIASRRGADSPAVKLFIEAVVDTRDEYVEQHGQQIKLFAS
jgi:DNA-binding transcriptional LysR family regulator